jgi:hypothetical protein
MALAGLYSLVAMMTVACSSTVPVTEIEFLGNPSKERYGEDRVYARNVWDMQAFGGKLYLGHGNSNNTGPAPNAGPVDVWSYDPTTHRFTSEYVVNEEQIASFRAAGSDLLIPGHDPRESWDRGNFYRKRSGRWLKYRTIPGGVHTFDILPFQDQLFAALGTEKGAEVARSTDEGNTWVTHPMPISSRAFTLFELQDRLYVCGLGLSIAPQSGESVEAYLNRIGPVRPRISVWDGNSFTDVPLEFFPNSKRSPYAVVVRPVNFRGRLLYIGAEPTHEHHWTPLGLFVAAALDQVERIHLQPGEAPWDLLVHDEHCYLLTASPENGDYLIRVRVSADLKQWPELLSFRQPAFARSFEILDEHFYFGLGSHPDQAKAETGNILRTRRLAPAAPDR